MVKVKLHCGIAMNEEADHWEGIALNAESSEVDWHFSLLPPDDKMTFTWLDSNNKPCVMADAS